MAARLDGAQQFLVIRMSACNLKARFYFMANKEQKKQQKATPKSNKQKKEAAREKKAAKSSKSPL